MGLFDRFRETYILPFEYQIPTYTQEYLQSTKLTKRFFKYLRRYLNLFLKSQLQYEKNIIQDNDKKILWINQSAPSLGDSLMDLSSRILLEGRSIDLFTSAKNKSLYLNDKFFQNIYSDENQLVDKKYDLIIIDSYSTRSIKIKNKYFYDTPYVGMYGFFNGPEVNRVLFSFFKMNKLLGRYLKDDEILNIAKPSIYVSNDDIKLIKTLSLTKDDIVISIGGEWGFKIYKEWVSVIQAIQQLTSKKVVLIGSNNAIEYIKEIKSSNTIDQNRIIDCVAKYTPTQTAQIISECGLFVGCDGGLMHIANSVGTPIVPLLARLEANILLTPKTTNKYLYDKTNCNNITPSQIISLLKDLI